ncbi:DUF4252 domain-containing protein [Robertkochia solimangrovi]|uniref:DUF4252 domain-containing protein n=1 Tax=Robertkochia solimangrovi TaxID=2213046 RepID=UPI001180C0B2|nr:DUF4252 domain-containing protein [Robertkochia solimangrovi]TRZ43648.1 DUF4252 domain-containing protein [Robertkochia solimangrovi]
MKSIRIIPIVLMGLFMLVSCNQGETLQQYYVNNSEKADFLVIDIPSSILKVSEIDLTPQQKEAYNSIKKLNVLAYRIRPNSTVDFESEKQKINEILSNDRYQELMRINMGDKKGVVKYLGDDDAIDEVIVFGSQDSLGFALIRVLGNDMKPENMTKLMEVVQKGNMDGEGLSQLANFFGE